MRTAFAYLLENVFGMVLWAVVFYALNAVFSFPFMHMAVSPVIIAVINSAVRIVTAVALFPFIKWLEKILMDAAERDLRCLIFSHTGFSGEWESTPDWREVRAIFDRANEKRKGTVLLSASGHLHTNHLKVIDGVVHFDVNTVRNGHWQHTPDLEHYDGLSIPYTEYNENGDPVCTYNYALNDLWMSKQTWYFAKPLSAIVTVSTDGEVIIEGDRSDWYANIAPDEKFGRDTQISGGTFRLI
jgi:hypothetical protein